MSEQKRTVRIGFLRFSVHLFSFGDGEGFGGKRDNRQRSIVYICFNFPGQLQGTGHMYLSGLGRFSLNWGGGESFEQCVSAPAGIFYRCVLHSNV